VEQGSTPAYRNTRDLNASLSEKQWSVNLCSAYNTENIELRTVSQMFDNTAYSAMAR
jgi:hypothetical protein